MFTGLCIGSALGLSLGIGLLIWFVIGDHLSLKIPHPDILEDDFTTRQKFWANLCIGDAEIEHLHEEGCEGDMFARLKVNSGQQDQLVLAQLDDYSYRPHADFPWQPPLRLEFRVRFSSQNGSGTAGFYLWNNPLGLGSEATNLRPLKWIGMYRIADGAYMKFSDQSHNFRATVSNGRWLDILTFLGLPFAPKLRLKETGLDSAYDLTQWHTYAIEWLPNKINIAIDDDEVLSYETALTTRMGLVIWCDNNFPQISLRQFDLKMSNVETKEWLDIDYVKIHPLN